MNYTELENYVLGHLSFYDEVTLAELILSFDSEFLEAHPQFSHGDLENILNSFYKRGMLERLTRDQKVFWKRTHPPRNLAKKIWLKILR